MLIGDSLIYIELHKTGCSFVRKMLLEFDELELKVFGKHNTLSSVNANDLGNIRTKLKVGNIRNPWDWYVSLWAHGCDSKGGLYDRLTKRPKLNTLYHWKRFLMNPRILIQDTQIWNDLYSDYTNPDNFQSWLKKILVERKYDLGENYSKKQISNIIGLLTHRYLRLYTMNYYSGIDRLKEYENIKNFESENIVLDKILRNESLNKDLFNLLEFIGIEEERIKKSFEKNSNKVNKSTRKNYRFYYNQYSIDLVAQKEKLIIDKYGYTY